MSIEFELSETDVAILRILNDHYHRAELPPRFELLAPVRNLPTPEQRRIRLRLTNYGLTGGEMLEIDEITPLGRAHLESLDNPPPKDYWTDAIVWFRSKPWSVPLIAIIVLIPIVQGWAASISWLINWLYDR